MTAMPQSLAIEAQVNRECVDMLNGTKPQDIPFYQPLVINLKTANLLGIDVAHTLLALIDEVIE
jgi:ABC-type uncharacterized transport system substrate-binding protein